MRKCMKIFFFAFIFGSDFWVEDALYGWLMGFGWPTHAFGDGEMYWRYIFITRVSGLVCSARRS